MDLSDKWVVVQQDDNGDRFFTDPEGYWTPDFFRAVHHNSMAGALDAARGRAYVLPAKIAHQLTVA
jgi:hypothetical protein